MFAESNFSIQGHRGCRGLLPENTIPAFIKAIQLGVTTLELDVVITKDNKVLVSHEPWLNHEICLDTKGNEIPKEAEMSFNLYQMMYDDIKQFDCGSRAHQRFPSQTRIKAYKPLLEEVIDSVENYCEQNNIEKISYNIEIKSLPLGDNLFHPQPKEFCEFVVSLIAEKNIKQFNLQSFDLRILKYLHLEHPQIKLAMLIENKNSIEDNIIQLGFVPQIYSPDYHLVNEQTILFCKKNNMQLIPWTVNEKEKMQELINLGVNGIITDYPDILISLLNSIAK